MNRYGVDTDYLRAQLKKLEKTLENRTQEELWNYFNRLAELYKPSVIIEHGYITEKSKKHDGYFT